MNWLDKLERKFGRYAIDNLMLYIVILYGFGFILDMVNPTFYSTWLSLDAPAISTMVRCGELLHLLLIRRVQALSGWHLH